MTRRTAYITDIDDVELTLEPTQGEPIRIFDSTGELAVEFVGAGRRVLSTRVCPDPSMHKPKRHWLIRLIRWLASRGQA